MNCIDFVYMCDICNICESFFWHKPLTLLTNASLFGNRFKFICCSQLFPPFNLQADNGALFYTVYNWSVSKSYIIMSTYWSCCSKKFKTIYSQYTWENTIWARVLYDGLSLSRETLLSVKVGGAVGAASLTETMKSCSNIDCGCEWETFISLAPGQGSGPSPCLLCCCFLLMPLLLLVLPQHEITFLSLCPRGKNKKNKSTPSMVW